MNILTSKKIMRAARVLTFIVGVFYFEGFLNYASISNSILYHLIYGFLGISLILFSIVTPTMLKKIWVLVICSVTGTLGFIAWFIFFIGDFATGINLLSFLIRLLTLILFALMIYRITIIPLEE